MKQKAIVLALGSLLAATSAHADIDLMGKELQMYGKLHASVDYYDRGTATTATPDPKGVEITSNSSRLGFKGEKELNSAVSAIWMFESEVDTTGESGTLAARNRYVGLKGGWGSFKLGINDTPFKEVGADYTAFGDTVGDRRGILGQTSGADNQFNQRAKSMAMYEIKAGGFKGSLMYSPDFEGKSNPDGGGTTTATHGDSLIGLGLGYKIGDLDLAAAYEKQDNIDGTAHKNANGYRVGVKYKIAGFKIGGVFEGLRDDGYGAIIERNAYGVNVAYQLADFTLAAQYLKADASAVTAANDGADEYTIGAYYDVAKSAQLYLAYASLKNDAGASYSLARSGHGQQFDPTAAGETVKALSAGLVYSF
jgi:predicted porin